MATKTLTPELEIAAARMDLWCTASILANAAYWMRVLAGVPQSASVWYAYTILEQRAGQGDKSARRKLTDFGQAATRYEGARVALAELVGAEEPVRDAAMVLTGDDAHTMREAVARNAA